MTLVVTILGCGSSAGVPRPAQGWGACDPAEPRNRRRRCAILVEQTGPGGVTTVLVDTGPDLRDQLISAGVTRLDAVLYTHDHADHVHGIDDIRPIMQAMRRRIQLHADDITASTLRQRFGYCFASPPGSDYPPIADLHEFGMDPVTVEGPGGPIRFQPVPVEHGAGYRAFGFRFNDVVYCPDVSMIPASSQGLFRDARLIILDALRYTRHPTHLSVDEALAYLDEFAPMRAVLTNLHIDVDYRVLEGRLPTHIVPAFDGLRLHED
jgi:phosphoribosyl 1,2-cyclic phosphate phosphodiesterase